MSTLAHPRRAQPLRASTPPPAAWRPGALALVLFVLGCNAIGVLGALATDLGPWYAELAKPSWQPPPWLFGPVWTLLYTLMGVALWLALRRTDAPRVHRQAVVLAFVTQLVLNAIWSPIFFGAHRLDVALLVIVALLFAIAWTMVELARISRAATALFVPYLAWVGFAGVLNFTLWRLNP